MGEKNRIGTIIYVETEDKYSYPYQTWYQPLQKISKKVVTFDPRWNFFHYGKDKMNEMFLNLVKIEKPDHIFLFIGSDEFYISTLIKIRNISPKTLLFAFFSDDDIYYSSHTRYIHLFIDYATAFQRKYFYLYKKDGFPTPFSADVTNTDLFKPINLVKKYDVTFIGYPLLEKAKRYDYIKYLKDNGIKINLMGRGWTKYPDLKEIYNGAPNSEDMVKIINQSKINLCLSRSNQGKTSTKTKMYEAVACNTFVLTEYCDGYLDKFKEGRDIISFKTKEELLEKVNYYLKNEKERKKIAKNAYKIVTQKCNIYKMLKEMFNEINTKNPNREHKNIIKISKKIKCITKKDLDLGNNRLKEILKNYDYVYFKKGKSQNLEFREYLQLFSLEKSKKEISCGNYNVFSKSLGDYLYFISHLAIKTLDKKIFDSLIDINQIMVKKNYFLKNYDIFKKVFEGKEINFINEDNTVFVSLPIVRIWKCPVKKYEIIKKVYKPKFLYHLFSLKSQNKLFRSIYPYLLLLNIFKGQKFIVDAIKENITDNDKKKKLESFKRAS